MMGVQQAHAGNQGAPDVADDEKDWLRIARECYVGSTDYFDNNVRKEIEDSLRMFDNKHPNSSKYLTKGYSRRSKFFMPKSRSMVRKHEAAASVAFFSNEEFFDCKAQDPADPLAADIAALVKALMQYRLDHSIPWYTTLIGAAQDAHKTGLCISYNYWMLKTRKRTREAEQQGVDAQGNPVTFMGQEEFDEITENRPCIDLIPRENLRFSPSAKWNDVVGTSPYLIRIAPMTAYEVMERIKTGEWKGEENMSMNRIVALGSMTDNTEDSTRRARQTGRQDPETEATEMTEYTIVYPREYYIKRNGETYVFWTLGDGLMLTEPMYLDEVYLHDQIPITIGFVVLETHKTDPRGTVALGAPTQLLLNDIGNQRMDNVRLVLNKQWLIRSGAQIDTTNIVNNVPGGATLVGNVESDVKPLEWGDVTGSAYQETDRANAQYDEITGNFGASSVDTNRHMGETVGGMSMLKSGTDSLTEYGMQLLARTWVIPTLMQLAELEKYYEDDETILAICASKAGVADAWRNVQMLEDNKQKKIYLKIVAGLQATDSNQKLTRFMGGLSAVAQMTANPIPGANMQELSKELFGLLGYGDGSRFFNGEDYKAQIIQQAQQEAQQLMEQAAQSSQKILDAAYKQQDKAESDERAAMEEQMQLINKQLQLLAKEFSLDLRELQMQDGETAAADTQRRAQTVSNLANIIMQFDARVAELQAALDELAAQDQTGVGAVVSEQAGAIVGGVKEALTTAQRELLSKATGATV